MNQGVGIFRLKGGSALAALAISLCPVAASAQDAPATLAQTPEPGTASTEEITVTGSRIVRNGFNAPTPVTVVGAELISNLGQVNVSETLKLIPQNSNFQSDSVAGITAGANVGASFGNLRGLNPFNGTRTLTLVNSRRFVPTSDGGAVDLNVIPSAMIQRIETVTGGASAAYGSDAIAGVINIILEKNLEGFKAQVDYGQTFRDDGKGYHGSLIFGTKLGSRGHVVVGGEYQKNNGIGDCSKVREWCAEGYDIFGNSGNILRNGGTSGYNVAGSPGDPFPNFVIGPNSKQAFNDPRGVVRADARTNPAARYYRFTDDGQGIIQYDPGMFVSSAQIGPRQGGDGVSTYDDSDLQTPLKRYVGYLYGTYELLDGINFETELTYANRTASNSSYLTGPRSTFYVNPDNPYIPAALSALLAGTQFSLGKDMDYYAQSVNTAKAKVFRGLAGLNGKIGDNWSWSFYYQYGNNKRHQDKTFNRVNQPFQYALDAVRNPANGQIVCRELLKANPDPRAIGCKPMNLFGLTNLDPAALAYVYRPVVEDFKYVQHVLSGSIQGNLHQGWGAGPIGFAAGIDYRDEKGDVTHGNIPDYNDYAFTFGLDFAGKINVVEGFSEVNVPVFRDFALGDLFELNGAVRYTRNKSTDTLTGEEKTAKATTWKISGIYDVFGGLRFRGSRSRDLRAAGFRELFNKQTRTEPGSTSGIVDNPAIPGSPLVGDDPTPILNGGSFALNPEKADTTTLGGIYSPTFLPGLRFSVDWYQIKIGNAIAIITAQQIVNFCRDYQIFCDRITYASPTDITFIDARQLNLAKLKLRGFDLEVDYRLRLADISSSLPGQLNLRVLGNRQYDFISQATPATPPVDGAGQSGPVADGGNFNASPPWIWNGFVSYDVGGFNVTTNIRYIPKGKYRVDRIGPEDEGYDPNLPNSINTNRVKAATYVSLAMTYRIPFGQGGSRQYAEVFGAIDNLFDKKPPVAPGGGGGGGSNYPTNPVYFDTFGSRFRAGIRVRY